MENQKNEQKIDPDLDVDKTVNPIKKEETINSVEKSWQPGVYIFLRLSAWIAIPVIIGSLLGDYLDNKYNKAPWFLLICVGLAFIVSMYGLISNTTKEYRKIAESKKDSKQQSNVKNDSTKQ